MLVCAIPAQAQVAEPAGNGTGRDPRWTHFTFQPNGQMSNSVHAVFVDREVIWFGGEAGIGSFNGLWKTYTSADGADGINGAVTAFAKDAISGLLWATTDSGQILQWNGTQWSQVLDLQVEVHALSVVAGDLWIAGHEGLLAFDGVRAVLLDAPGRQPIYALYHDSGDVWAGTEDGLWRFRDGRWLHIGALEPLFGSGVHAVLVGPLGEIIVGTPHGLGWQMREGATWRAYEIRDEDGHRAPIRSLVVDSRTGVLWTAADEAGVFAFDPNRGTVDQYGYTGDPNLTTRFVRQVAVDVDGSVWFATPAGIFRFQALLWQNSVIGEPNDATNHINDILVARDGTVWAATAGGGIRRGVGEYGGETVYRSADGAADDAIALAQDIAGAVWAGGESGLRRYSELGWEAPVASSSLPGRSVAALLADGRSLWIGTNGGLARMDIPTLALDPVKPLTGLSITALSLDSLGRLWLGTDANGIWLRETEGRWRQFTDESRQVDRLPGSSVRTHGLIADPRTGGGVWAIVDGKQVVRWDGRRWIGQRNNAREPSDLLWALHADPSDGALWIGSEVGATRYDGSTAATLGVDDGLQSANIYVIAGTKETGYWFGGRTGISHFRPDTTPPWIDVDVHAVDRPGNSVPSASSDEPLRMTISAGDLQASADKLKILYRQTGPDGTSAWVQTQPSTLEVMLPKPGHYVLEFRACDLSFNYSPIVTRRVDVVRPSHLVWFPMLGMIEAGARNALLLLGTLVLMGGAYLSFAIVNNRRRGLLALARAFNPYISGEPVRRDDMFFARHDLLQRIVDTLHINSIMIHGERRIGKTTLLYHLVTALREVEDDDYWFVPVYVDLEGTPQSLFFHLLIEEIAVTAESVPHAGDTIRTQLANLRYHTKIGRGYSDRDFTHDLRHITEVLERYGALHVPGRQLRLILLIDEMDVMSKYDRLVQQQLRRIFMREFSATLGAVVAGIQISKDWDRVESPWFNMFNEIALTPFTREQAAELLVEPVRGYYRYDKEALAFVLDHAGGRPYKVQQYGLEAVNHMLARGRRRITLADAQLAHRRMQVAERKEQASRGAVSPSGHMDACAESDSEQEPED